MVPRQYGVQGDEVVLVDVVSCPGLHGRGIDRKGQRENRKIER